MSALRPTDDLLAWQQMAHKGRPQRFNSGATNDRYRRNLVIAAELSEVRFRSWSGSSYRNAYRDFEAIRRINVRVTENANASTNKNPAN